MSVENSCYIVKLTFLTVWNTLQYLGFLTTVKERVRRTTGNLFSKSNNWNTIAGFSLFWCLFSSSISFCWNGTLLQTQNIHTTYKLIKWIPPDYTVSIAEHNWECFIKYTLFCGVVVLINTEVIKLNLSFQFPSFLVFLSDI